MKPTSQETLCRQLFVEQREQDARHATAFEHAWRQAQRRRGSAPARRGQWLVTAAVAGMVLAGVTLSLRSRLITTTPAPVASTTLAITEWRSSTDFLLHTPGEQILTTIPQLGVTAFRPEPVASPSEALNKKEPR